MGRPKIWFELGRYADFTLYGHKDLTGSFELIRSPRKDGIPNPKRRFVFDWNEKRWRLAASRDVTRWSAALCWRSSARWQAPPPSRIGQLWSTLKAEPSPPPRRAPQAACQPPRVQPSILSSSDFLSLHAGKRETFFVTI
jgi:hypothetical protein